MIKKYSLKALEIAINKALSLDESSASRMKDLHGKILKIIINPLNVCFYMTFKDTRLLLEDEITNEPDTVIQSNPLGLIRLSLLPASKARSLFNDKISLSGDVALGESIKKLFDNLDIDWEGHLARFTGDVAAYQLGSLFKRSSAFTKHFALSMQQNATEYLQEEKRLVPGRMEMEDFFRDVERLQEDTERLQARMDLLKAKHETV